MMKGRSHTRFVNSKLPAKLEGIWQHLQNRSFLHSCVRQSPRSSPYHSFPKKLRTSALSSCTQQYSDLVNLNILVSYTQQQWRWAQMRRRCYTNEELCAAPLHLKEVQMLYESHAVLQQSDLDQGFGPPAIRMRTPSHRLHCTLG